MVHAHQNEYYQALNLSTQKTDSAPFIEFMLGMILGTIESNTGNSTPQVSQQVTPQVEALLKVLLGVGGPLTRSELQSLLLLKDRESFRERYLKPALAFGLIEMTLPDKPNSRLQHIASRSKVENGLARSHSLVLGLELAEKSRREARRKFRRTSQTT